MSCDVGEVIESDSLTFPSLHLRHSSFSNLSLALSTSQLILQPFRCFIYVTAHSPTLLSLLLRHRIFTYVTWRAAHAVQGASQQLMMPASTVWNIPWKRLKSLLYKLQPHEPAKRLAFYENFMAMIERAKVCRNESPCVMKRKEYFVAFHGGKAQCVIQYVRKY